MLSLTSGTEQTPAASLQIEEVGQWQAIFTLPNTTQGAPLWGELRALPGGAPALVQLGEIPRLFDWLNMVVREATLDNSSGRVQLQVEIENTGEGAVFLDEDFIQAIHEGGDAYGALDPTNPGLLRQIMPQLPQGLEAGRTLELTAAFALLPAEQASSAPQEQPRPESIRLQIGADLWELSAFGTLSTDRQP